MEELDREELAMLTEEERLRYYLRMKIENSEVPIEGQTWDTEQLKAEFEVFGFAAPFVLVRRKSTGEKGALLFKHHPRIYFDWRPHE